MGTSRYRFHCTDGRDAVFDRTGQIVPGEHRLRALAIQTACGVMACDVRFEWSDWFVDVHDAAGRRCMTVAFSEARAKRRVD